MTASTQSTVRQIELVTDYELDGEWESCVQQLSVQFLSTDTAVVFSSSGIFDDFRLLYGDHIVVSSLPDERFKLVGVEHPSPMRHFESAGGGNGPFPTEELHRIGGEWESELMCWTTHIPTAELDAFCERTGLRFHSSTEVFSGLSSILL
jgi:hypothetical protein